MKNKKMAKQKQYKVFTELVLDKFKTGFRFLGDEASFKLDLDFQSQIVAEVIYILGDLQNNKGKVILKDDEELMKYIEIFNRILTIKRMEQEGLLTLKENGDMEFTEEQMKLIENKIYENSGLINK